jgi:Fe-S-cluster containining protein
MSMDHRKLQISEHADKAMQVALTRHKCTGCGACCRWPGQIFLYPDDIKRIARRLELSVEDFLLSRCAITWWRWASCTQYRICLARKPQSTECVFLTGSLCGIHESKPLLCKAGPAASAWIMNPRSFWYFVEKSPSFRHEIETTSLSELNDWFVATCGSEEVASQATSLTALAVVSGVSADVIQGLKLIEFKKEIH